jgi:hypothetical protein
MNWLEASTTPAKVATILRPRRRTAGVAPPAPVGCVCGARGANQREEEFNPFDYIPETAWLMTKVVAGERDANRLANLVFWRRHPELNGQKIRSDQRELANEWLGILREVVQPTLAKLGGRTNQVGGPTPRTGGTPAPGTAETRRSFPTNPPRTNAPGARSAATYDAVLDQFAVDVNPRYAIRNGATFCNIFVWDVTRAMGAEVPHWVDRNGDPTPHNSKLGNELNANAVNRWLHEHGARYGWQQVDLRTAVAHANQGRPVVASHNNVGGIGHVAMVRPGNIDPSYGPLMAQAGSTNSNGIRLHRVWKKSTNVEFWSHD